MGKIATGQTMRSAERLLQVLNAFTLEQPRRTISDLSATVSLASSTVRRIVAILEKYGYLRLESAIGHYAPHFQAVRLGGVALASFDLLRAASPILDRLSEKTGEAVELTMRSGPNAVVVSSRTSKQLFRLVRPTGSVYPCYRGAAAGKVLLAWLDALELNKLLPPKGVWPGDVPQHVTSKRVLLRELAAVRAQGYATTSDETEADVWVVAAPIRDHDNRVVAALGVPCLASRVPAVARRRLAKLLRQAADELTGLAQLRQAT
jgi:DNA-binding IclR family transcriptional regulator